MTFNDLKFEDWIDGVGVQAWVDFSNGYSTSVVRHTGSYGSDKGLFEIGVFHGNLMVDPADWGDTVKGWLNESDVEHWLNYIEKL